jgi:hypothetical protein
MKNNIFKKCRSSLSLFFILTLVLVHFPVVSLAFSLPNPYHSGNKFISSTAFNSLSTSYSAVLPMVIYSNTTSITITDRDNNTNPGGSIGISNPYPSTIPVSGLSGTVSDVNVTITGFNAARPRDIDVVLVAPSGQALTLMADTGGLNVASGVTITFDDAAPSFLPETTPISTGTYKPTDYVFSATDRDDFPSPGPSSVNDPAPTGTATLASVFNGINPNGNWSLYIIDDSLGGGNSTITGGWSIDITTAVAAAATSTSVSSNINPALTTQTITFASTTTSNGNPVTTGTVSFTQNGNAISGCTNISVNASGIANCITTLPEGTRTISATYNGTASFGQSSGGLSQVVNSPTVVSGSQFCNNGGITIPDPGSATPYPSNITVSGLTGTIGNVTVQLNGLNAPRPSNLDFLLVGSNGQAFEIMSDAGDATTPANVTLTLDDNAASQLPTSGALSSGTFRPTDADQINTDTYPAPAPATINQPAPSGSATFTSVYGGANPNGNWALYAVDDGIGGGSSTLTGWCVNFTINKFTTTTTVTTSKNPSNTGEIITFTATVTSEGGTPTGTVNFFDGATNIGSGTLNGSGQATLATSLNTPGGRNITAQYVGANIGAGGGGFAADTSDILIQNVLAPTAAPVTISGRVITQSGRGIRNVMVTMTDSQGNQRTVQTTAFGYYHFDDVRAGETVTLTAKARRFKFNQSSIVRTTNESINNADFISVD